jgi:hypothetical protein
MTRTRAEWLQISVLLCLTGFAYLEVRHHHFVWDTIPFVLENPWVHEWTLDNVLAMFSEAHRANWHPMVLLSHALDISIFGYNSGAHHLVNLGLHAANALLVLYLVKTLLDIHGLGPDASLWTGFMTAIVFALHPQHVESVAWVVERKDVLYTLFLLCSLISYLKVRQRHETSWRAELLPFFFFCLSIGAKPMAVTLPIVLLMLDVTPLRRFQPDSVLKLILEKAHYFAVSLVVGIVTLLTQSSAMADIQSLPLWARSLNAVDNTWFYVAHYIWPLDLSPYYPYPQNAAYLADPQFWLAGAMFLVAGTTVSLIFAWKRVFWPGLLFAFYLLTLLPVSGFIHVGPAKATDHYVYVATLPLSLLTALLVARVWQRLPRLRVAIVPIVVLYFAFLLVVTQVQLAVWRNPLTLWTDVTTRYPDSPFGHRNIAAVYASMNEWDLALKHAELSLALGSPDESYVEKIRQQHALQNATSESD